MTPLGRTLGGLGLCLLGMAGRPATVAALEQNDTMGAWLGSSDADRSRLLDALQANDDRVRQADRTKLMACINAAAEIAGHRDLRISDVADACSEAQPTTGGPHTDI